MVLLPGLDFIPINFHRQGVAGMRPLSIPWVNQTAFGRSFCCGYRIDSTGAGAD